MPFVWEKIDIIEMKGAILGYAELILELQLRK